MVLSRAELAQISARRVVIPDPAARLCPDTTGPVTGDHPVHDPTSTHLRQRIEP